MMVKSVTVYMKADAQSTGKQHQHEDVELLGVEAGAVRLRYPRMRLLVAYPLTSIEKWEVRE